MKHSTDPQNTLSVALVEAGALLPRLEAHLLEASTLLVRCNGSLRGGRLAGAGELVRAQGSTITAVG